MLARHSYLTPNAEALLVLYSAKKDAEVAPGVGPETDVWALGPQVGQWVRVDGEMLAKLEIERRRIRSRNNAVWKKAKEEMSRYVEKLGKRAAESQAKPPPSGGETGSGRETETPAKE